MKLKLPENLKTALESEIYNQLKKRLEGAEEIDYKIDLIYVEIKTSYALEIEEEKNDA